MNSSNFHVIWLIIWRFYDLMCNLNSGINWGLNHAQVTDPSTQLFPVHWINLKTGVWVPLVILMGYRLLKLVMGTYKPILIAIPTQFVSACVRSGALQAAEAIYYIYQRVWYIQSTARELFGTHRLYCHTQPLSMWFWRVNKWKYRWQTSTWFGIFNHNKPWVSTEATYIYIYI